MDETPSTKKYPVTTDEVAKLLGLKPSGTALPMSSVSATDLPVLNLPVDSSYPEVKTVDLKTYPDNSKTEHFALETTNPTLDAVKNPPAYAKFAKAAIPYLGVFTAGLFLYYFFFSNVNFNNIFKNTVDTVSNKTSSITAPQQTALQELQKQSLAGYNTWISGFYYDVSDSKITNPNTDNSGNGLSNFQKYLLNLNPKSYDTLGLGIADSQSLANGISPLSGTPLTDAQKEIVSKYFDMEVIMNRLALANLQNSGKVAGVNINNNNNNSNNRGLRGLSDIKNQAQVQGQNTVFNSPQTGANVNLDDKSVDINNKIPGHLDIPSLNVAVPIVWSAEPGSFEQDLQAGVIHYPGTAVPGQIGTTYIAGHSSNYFWAKGSYNKVFTQLGDLKDSASFSVSVTDNNGKLITYHYVVVSRKEYVPTDPAQITNTGKSLVALSTCWPVNSTAKRLVVYGQLTQVER